MARIAAIVTIATAPVLGIAAASASARAPGALQFRYRAIHVGEDAGRVLVEVGREATAALDHREAGYETVDRTAVAAHDYMSARGRIRMGMGETTSTITVFLHDDVEVENGNETFLVRITDPNDRSYVLDEAMVTIRDDDHERASIETVDTEVDDGDAAPAPVASAATAAEPPRPVQAMTPSRRAATTRRATGQPTGERRVRVTPFELRGPDGTTQQSLPAPEHTTPIAAAGLVAALALGRVTAELWYRWRVREI